MIIVILISGCDITGQTVKDLEATNQNLGEVNQEYKEINEFYRDYLAAYSAYALDSYEESYWSGEYNALIDNYNFGASIFEENLEDIISEYKLMAKKVQGDIDELLLLLDKSPEDFMTEQEIKLAKKTFSNHKDLTVRNIMDMEEGLRDFKETAEIDES